MHLHGHKRFDINNDELLKKHMGTYSQKIGRWGWGRAKCRDV